MHDHTGNFAAAIDGVNTPELQQADNDYAVGLLVQKIANSQYANDTLIFVVEDDSQDGGDHVDSHRSILFVAGAWVKRGVVVSTQYNTIDLIRTMEEVLGLPAMNLNDALASPMADIFNTTPSPWSFTATPSAYLYGTQLPLPPQPAGLVVPKSTHDAAYWARVTKGMDFSKEDRFDFAAYNRVLWTGLMGDTPYPTERSGLDLRENRKELLARHRASEDKASAQRSKTVAAAPSPRSLQEKP
jgi:DNA-binding beta-propeller fold protein YncE